MAFFHAQGPIVQPHYDHSHSTSGSTINDELDMETVALIAKLALDDLADVMGARKGKARADSLPSDEEIAYRLQSEQYDQWLSIVEDAKLAKSIEGALVTDAAYLDAFITAEEAAAEDRIAAELLSRGEALPVPKGCQTRLEHPNFIMNPELITVPGMDVTQSYQAGLDASNSDVVKNRVDDETVDNDSMDGEQMESDSDEIHPFSTAQSKHSNAIGKRSIAGPSANHNKRADCQCIICNESCRYSDPLKTPCDHYYCRNCFLALVKAFTPSRDEPLFTLRCRCQDPIPVAEVLPTLPLELRSPHDQPGRTRQSGQHLQDARIKLRVDSKYRRVIPEPPALRPVMHIMDHNTTQPLGPISRPIVKNSTLPTRRFSATMTAPSPRKSSPLGSSQHQLPMRPGFPLSKPKPDFYRRALIKSGKASRAQAGQINMWISNAKWFKNHASASPATSMKQSLRVRA